MSKKILALLAIVSVFILAACSSSESTTESTSTSSSEVTKESDNLQVVASFYPMYEFAEKVGGEAADVSLMIPAGGDVHGYEPSAKDLANLQTADAFVYANTEMETWVPSVLESINTDNLTVIQADEEIELIETGEAEEGHDHENDHSEEGHTHTVDPHTWVDPANAIIQVTQIKEKFIEADPENTTTYEDNAASYISELQTLKTAYDSALNEVENTEFITQHAAFGYLANRYGLRQYSLAGVSADTEASPQVMAELVTLIEEHELPVVYYNVNENESLANTVAQEAGVQTAPLHTLESLTDEEIAEGKNYINVMRDNLESLTLSIR